MDKNQFIGFALIALVVLVFTISNAPSQDELAEKQRVEDSIAQVQATKAVTPQIKNTQPIERFPVAKVDSSQVDSLGNVQEDGLFGATKFGTEEFYTIENEVLSLIVSNKGGRIVKAIPKNFQTFDSLEVNLMNENQGVFNYVLSAKGVDQPINTQSRFFEVDGGSFTVSGDEEKSIAFRLKADNDSYLELKYTLKGDSYFVDYDLSFPGYQTVLNYPRLDFRWTEQYTRKEKEHRYENQYNIINFMETDNDISRLGANKERTEKSFGTKVRWVSFKQQFFNATLIAEKGFDSDGKVIQKKREDDEFFREYSAQFNVPLTDGIVPMELYLGPNDFSILRKRKDLNLQKIVPLGWGIFGWVNKFLIIPVFNFLERYIPSYGIIILILTLIINLLVFPFYYKSYVSAAKMKAIRPEIAELQAKFGKDAQKMQMEQMKLYKKTGVNMLGGCLPNLIPLPIWIAMYRFFPSSIELRQSSFLWADDLSTYDSVLDLPFDIPMYGAHVSLFTILMFITQFFYIRYSAKNTPTAGSGMAATQMKMMQYFMPFMLLIFFNSFAAGLTAYIFFSNIIRMAFQWISNTFLINHDKLRAEIEENKKKPVKRSAWQQRMEDMLKEQQKKAGQGKKK